MILRLVSEARWRVLAVESDDGCQLLEYLDALGEGGDADKMLALLQGAAEHGPPRNKEKCRYPLKGLSDHVGELKAGALRAYFFYNAGRIIICSHVGSKPKSKQLKREVEYAEGVREAYLAATATGKVVI